MKKIIRERCELWSSKNKQSDFRNNIAIITTREIWIVYFPRLASYIPRVKPEGCIDNQGKYIHISRVVINSFFLIDLLWKYKKYWIEKFWIYWISNVAKGRVCKYHGWLVWFSRPVIKKIDEMSWWRFIFPLGQYERFIFPLGNMSVLWHIVTKAILVNIVSIRKKVIIK